MILQGRQSANKVAGCTLVPPSRGCASHSNHYANDAVSCRTADVVARVRTPITAPVARVLTMQWSTRFYVPTTLPTAVIAASGGTFFHIQYSAQFLITGGFSHQ
jgi:hypothetical protein